MAATWGLPCELPSEKNEIKRLVFRQILFGRVRPHRRRWRAFRHRWPTVAAVLEAVKQGDHGNSRRACQRIESKLMIDGVVGQFRRHHPDQPVFTIHDSVLVTPDFAEIAKTAIRGRVHGHRTNTKCQGEAEASEKDSTEEGMRQRQEAQNRQRYQHQYQYVFPICTYSRHLIACIVGNLASAIIDVFGPDVPGLNTAMGMTRKDPYAISRTQSGIGPTVARRSGSGPPR